MYLIIATVIIPKIGYTIKARRNIEMQGQVTGGTIESANTQETQTLIKAVMGAGGKKNQVTENGINNTWANVTAE